MQVSASKTKIYMVLEYVNGGELFDKIVRILAPINCLVVYCFMLDILSLLFYQFLSESVVDSSFLYWHDRLQRH